jgi:hypothetical protein
MSLKEVNICKHLRHCVYLGSSIDIFIKRLNPHTYINFRFPQFSIVTHFTIREAISTEFLSYLSYV